MMFEFDLDLLRSFEILDRIRFQTKREKNVSYRREGMMKHTFACSLIGVVRSG